MMIIINGNLDLSYSNIKSLGKLKEIKVSLHLNSSLIISLPEGLKVERNLNIEWTQIDELPKGLQVGRYIKLLGSKITKQYVIENRSYLWEKCSWD